MASPVVRESRLAIDAFLVQFPHGHGKTRRTRSFPKSQSTSRAWTDIKSKTQTRATSACQKTCCNRAPASEPLNRNCHAEAFASSGYEDRKDPVNQGRVPGDAACGAANSSRNVRGRRQRICKKTRLARDTPSRRAPGRVLQRHKQVADVAGGISRCSVRTSHHNVAASFHWTAQSCWLTNAPAVIKWKQRNFISLSSAF